MLKKPTIEDYALEIVGRCQSGQSRCERLVSADFASSAAKNLALTLTNVFQYLARVCDEVVKQINWTAQDDVDRDVTILRVLDWQVQEFASHIRYVESAKTNHLPWQVIPSFEKLVEFLKPRAQVMLRPMWRYNYATIVSNLRDLYLSELQIYEHYISSFDVESNIIHPLGEAFHIISFPALERNNILLHSVIGHELGHLLATELVEKSKQSFLNDVLEKIEKATDEELTLDASISQESAPLLFQQYRTNLITTNSNTCLVFFERAAEEIIADAVGAALFGPAALFSVFDIAVQSDFDLEPTSRNNYYPPWRRRIREILRAVEKLSPKLLHVGPNLFRMDSPTILQKRAVDLNLNPSTRSELVNERIRTFREIAADTSDSAAIAQDTLAEIAYSALQPYIDKSIIEVQRLLGRHQFNEAQVLATLPSLIERLDAGVTPNAEHDMPSGKVSKVKLVDVLNSAWYHKASLSVAPLTDEDRTLLEQARSIRNRLTLKAVEFVNVTEEYAGKTTRRRTTVPGPKSGGVLTTDDIYSAMEEPGILDRLILTPIFDPADSVTDAAVDVRLGTEFILFRKEAFHALDISSSEAIFNDVSRYQERVIRRIQERFVLHPRQLVIGSTLEYIQLPPDVMAYVIGKSTLGRTGLIIATATKVDPGFRGCITLEMVNEGEVPLVLFPGMPIAQLVLHRTERPSRYDGVYSCPIGPEFPRFDSLMREGVFWLPKKSKRS